MTREEIAALAPRLEPTSDHSVIVYDRDRREPGAQVIGTVNGYAGVVDAHRAHYSLAERASARVAGSFPTIGDGVVALIADHAERNAK